jgi:hypothetical protein
MYENNKYKERDRTTKEDHQWLKDNYKQKGYKSAAGFLEEIIKKYKNNEPPRLQQPL